MPQFDKAAALEMADGIKKLVPPAGLSLMEVCGTHTFAIAKSGLRQLLAPHIRFLSGPGCPVCVTAQEDIDRALLLAREQDVIITTFGDMVRVPGRTGSLESLRREGADVRVVYSPLDAVTLAAHTPAKKVIFIGVGFETTAPAVAVAVMHAARRNLKNFFVFNLLKTVPAALRQLLDAQGLKVDGFILPGHVCAVIGTKPFNFLAEKYNIPCAVSGFEPQDILLAVTMIAAMKKSGRAQVQNAYTRVVAEEGNAKACEMVERVFLPCRAKWRALGEMDATGLALRKEFSRFDAAVNFSLPAVLSCEPSACRCGEVLLGKINPAQCGLFGKQCTPSAPVGPCMVSSEGACAAAYHYGG